MILEQGKESRDNITLKTGDIWDMGNGWRLSAFAIDAKAVPKQAILSLSKDWIIIDSKGVEEGDVYTYSKKNINDESDVPIFVTYIDSIFSGRTSGMIKLRYTWLTSENITMINDGDRFGIFTVKEASSDKLLLWNENTSIDLSKNSTVDLIGNMKFRIDDDLSNLKFYPFIGPTGAELKAKKLADGIMLASSDDERYNALLDIMDTLNVGVYTPSGNAILRGAERGPMDFYLYDFEVKMMSRSLGRQDTWSVSDLTMGINNMEIFQEELTPLDIYSTLLEATNLASQNLTENLSVVPLLVRELGMRHAIPYDLLENSNNVPIENIKLDALQRFLIFADLTLPIVWENGQPDSFSTSNEPIIVSKNTQQESSSCEDIGKANNIGWNFGKLLSFLKGLANIKERIIDGIHGSILAYGIEVKALDSSLTTHYGHETPGKELNFRILVNMRDELPDIAIKCGRIAKVEIPKKGPIEGVTVLWFQEEEDIRIHGQLNCGFPCTSQTGPDGIANLIFQPKNEQKPFGKSGNGTTGLTLGVAQYISRFRDGLGYIAEFATPKSDGTRWFVSWHCHCQSGGG